MKKTKIIFTERTLDFILEAFNLETDQNDFIIKSDTKEKILSINGETIKRNELAGIHKMEFIKGDLHSLMDFVEKERSLTGNDMKENIKPVPPGR
jgi:hypothetical protein